MIHTIGIIIDVVIILALIITAIIGFNKGFLKSFLALFNWSVCIIIASVLAKYLAGWINEIYDFYSLIGGKITASLLNGNAGDFFATQMLTYQDGGVNALVNAIPVEVNGVLKKLIQVLFSNANIDFNTTKTVGEVVGLSLGKICMVIISGIFIFIVLKIVLALLSNVFDKISNTRVIGTLNKILGSIFNMAKTLIIILTFNAVLVALSLIPAVNKTITPVIKDNSHVENFIYTKTDSLFEKYVINGDKIHLWINNLWESR